MTPVLTNTTTYYAQTGFSCPSLSRDTVTITVLPLPPVNLGPDALTPCGVAITLDAGAGFVSYLWSTNETTQTISVDTTGDFSVTVTDANCCTNSDTIHVDCFVSVDEIATAGGVSVYPNPTSGMINVEFTQPVQSATIRWMDLQGQIIREEKVQGIMQKQYDLSTQTKGVYMLQVITDDSISLHRVLVQ